MLSPIAIALQGLGYGRLQIAVHGLLALLVPDEKPIGGGGKAPATRPRSRPFVAIPENFIRPVLSALDQDDDLLMLQIL